MKNKSNKWILLCKFKDSPDDEWEESIHSPGIGTTKDDAQKLCKVFDALSEQFHYCIAPRSHCLRKKKNNLYQLKPEHIEKYGKTKIIRRRR